jgi:O-antigen ligase
LILRLGVRQLLCVSLFLAIAGAIPFTANEGLLQPITRAGFLAAASAVLALAAQQGHVSATAAWRYFPLPLAAYLAWCALSTLWSESPDTTVVRLAEALVTFLYFQSFIFVLALTVPSIRDCAGVIATASVAVAAFGLLVNSAMFGTPFHYWLNPDVPDRPRFTFGYLHPLAAGDVLAIGILCGAFASWRLLVKVLVGACLFQLLAMTDSTGARLAVLGMLPVILLLHDGHPMRSAQRILCASLVACLALFALINSGADVALPFAADESNARLFTLTGRTQIWTAIFENGLASTPFGYGFEAARYVIGPLMGRSYHAHNLYLNVLVETGVVGFLIFLALIVCWVWRLATHGSLLPILLAAYVLMLSMNNPGMFTKQTIMLLFLLSYWLPAFFPRQQLQAALPQAAARSALA